MDIESVLVTGANRGIGLEFVRQFLGLPNPPRYLFATYRSENSAQELKNLQNASSESQVILIKMDVTNADDVKACREQVEDTVGNRGMSVLINNAGALNMAGWPDISDENILFHLNTNTMGPIRVLREMFPLLKKASERKAGEKVGFSRSAVLNISSMAGSILQAIDIMNGFSDVIGYKISKAALNMAMRVVSASTQDSGVLCVQMCPGWVQTDMGTDKAELDVKVSIEAMLRTVATLDHTHHGAYMDRHGNAIPF